MAYVSRGRHFIIKTDHQSLKHFLDARATTPAQKKWLTKLLGYDYTISYKRGIDNWVADALSHQQEESVSLSAISYIHLYWLDRMKEDLKKDPWIQAKISKLQHDHFMAKHYSAQDGLLQYDRHIVISPSSPWRTVILDELHTSPAAGHSSFQKTVQRVNKLFYWPHMRSDIRTYIAECEVCQRHKYKTLSPAGLLQPLPVPDYIWSKLSMDFIDALPNSRGYTVIMVVVDRLSKAAHFVALKHPYTATSVARAFMDNIIKLHGLPKSIVSDRDRIFTSKFWQELFQLQGTKLKLSSGYHPQTDGQTEVVNRCLETYLRCFVSTQPKQWVQWLSWAEYWYNPPTTLRRR
jgi:hypothetical protein